MDIMVPEHDHDARRQRRSVFFNRAIIKKKSKISKVHDCDVNAALNILRLGHQALGSEVAKESPTRKKELA